MEHPAETAEAQGRALPPAGEETAGPPDEEWPGGEGGGAGRENRRRGKWGRQWQPSLLASGRLLVPGRASAPPDDDESASQWISVASVTAGTGCVCFFEWALIHNA